MKSIRMFFRSLNWILKSVSPSNPLRYYGRGRGLKNEISFYVFQDAEFEFEVSRSNPLRCHRRGWIPIISRFPRLDSI